LLRLSLTTLPWGRQSKKSGQASVSPAPSVNGTLSWLALVDALDCSFAKSALACVPSKPAAQIKIIEEHLILAFDPAFDDVITLSDPQQARADIESPTFPCLRAQTLKKADYSRLARVTLLLSLRQRFRGLPSFIKQSQQLIPWATMG